ncbi:cytochrome c biogenesis CcdA family protein [Desulfovibrio ferrophilus]|uniref:Cytochrome c biogenesis protein transmembrane region n=1 Tax=Desulfovibrio ferrophilus TaxID=241368 RepID=A0A2Z6B316_9BACT|nr:cytochrome c biogenesis protein CcdA [Desulfovibrio ferrophilus]BBD09881.1 cytochrome c biogenesis protein transmembrane region [Desulfovibrio ferrophilus]
MNDLFITINGWIASGTAQAALGCLLWGMVSVLFSPCHLASIPLIVAYVGGQELMVEGRRAVLFAVLFSTGLFLTIAAVGITCSLLGRMLGEVGPYWTIAVGAVLIWVALDMLGVAKCSMSGGLMSRIKVRGAWGALILGLAYGLLSGSCTFGFIAPILAVVTVQGDLALGTLYILLFGIGHCIPIAIAGSSTATVRRLLGNSSMQNASLWFRKGAGVLVGGLGLYFVAQPFIVTP